MIENSFLTVVAVALYVITILGAAIYGREIASLSQIVKRIWKR